MNPALLILASIVLPTFFLVLLLGPIYLGMCGTMFFYYEMHNWKEYVYSPDYVFSTQSSLAHYWMAHKAQLGIMDFILPVWGPPVVGISISLWMIFRLYKYLSNIFKLQTM